MAGFANLDNGIIAFDFRLNKLYVAFVVYSAAGLA